MGLKAAGSGTRIVGPDQWQLIWFFMSPPPLGVGDILFSPGRLSVRPSVRPSVCLSACLTNTHFFFTYCFPPGVCLSLCLSVRPSVRPFVRPSVCLPACLSVSLPVCLSHSCPLYNLKTVQAIFTKLLININQHQTTCRAQKTITLAFIRFELFPLELYQSQNRVRAIT